MPYEVRNYAAEGVANGTVSADRRHTAQLEDYAKTRNDYFNLLGNRMAAVAQARDNPNAVDVINRLGDVGITAATPQMNADANGNLSFRREQANSRFVDPNLARLRAVDEVSKNIPNASNWGIIQNTPAGQEATIDVNGNPVQVSADAAKAQWGGVYANKQYSANALRLQQALQDISTNTPIVQNYEAIGRQRPLDPSEKAAYDKARNDLVTANWLRTLYREQGANMPDTFKKTGGLFQQD